MKYNTESPLLRKPTGFFSIDVFKKNQDSLVSVPLWLIQDIAKFAISMLGLAMIKTMWNVQLTQERAAELRDLAWNIHERINIVADAHNIELPEMDNSWKEE